MPAGGLLEAALRRDRLLLIGGLLLVVALAWGWIAIGAGMETSALEMTGMAGMDGWAMQPAVWTAGYALLMVSMWWVMMVAMMLPGAAPVLLLFARINRGRGADDSPLVPTGVFAAGYLAAWGGFSLLAAAVQWGLETTGLLTPMLDSGAPWLAASLLIGAGLWQLTPLKARCLRHCRTPLSFLLTRWRPGRGGAFRMGLDHGTYCLGCCWFLMALLFVGGVMNLVWIAALTLFVLLEKTLPSGRWLARAAGLLFCAGGLVLFATAG